MDYRRCCGNAVVLYHGVTSAACLLLIRAKNIVFVKSMGDALVVHPDSSLVLIANFMCITRLLGRRAAKMAEVPSNPEASCERFCCSNQIVGRRLLLLWVLIVTR